MEVRNLNRLWRVVSIAAMVMLFAATAWAANSVQVVSQTGLTGGTTVEIAVKISNDESLNGLYVPLVIRQVGSGGPTVTGLALKWRERLALPPTVLAGLVSANRYDSETGNCKAGSAGGFPSTPTQTDTLQHPVSALPVCGLFLRNSIFPATPMAAGADATGSIGLELQLAAGDGCVIIDTTCTDPNNHLLMVRAAGGAAPGLTYSAGVVCVGECAIAAVDEGSMMPTAASVDGDTVTYSWDPVSGATSYTIQIGFDANLSSILTEATVSFPTFQYVVPGDFTDTYWRVRANLADACSSDWTNSFKYTDVKNVTGELIPESYTLSQNYPNPFNAGTVIDFTMKNSGHVKLEVFNILGQSVVTLVDADKSAGVYSVSWDGTDSRGHAVPSGMYFYRLNADNFKEVKKMTLLK